MNSSRRGTPRTKPDLGSYAQIQLRGGTAATAAREFRPGLLGLISEESTHGCGLVLLSTPSLQVGDTCRVRTRKVGPVLAEVRWRTDIDSSVVRVGLKFLE